MTLLACRFSGEQIEHNGEVSPVPARIYVTSPHLIRLCHCELSLRVIWDRDVFMTTTFIPVGGLLTTHPSRFFHEPASKPAPHSEAFKGCCHSGDTSCASRAMADVVNNG